jgi:hypothetical protein
MSESLRRTQESRKPSPTLSSPTKICSAAAALSASYLPTGLVHCGLPLPPSPSQGPSTFGFPTTCSSPNVPSSATPRRPAWVTPWLSFSLSSGSGGNRYLTVWRHTWTVAGSPKRHVHPSSVRHVSLSFSGEPSTELDPQEFSAQCSSVPGSFLPKFHLPPPNSSCHHRPALATDACVTASAAVPPQICFLLQGCRTYR